MTTGIFSASGITQLYDTICNVKKYCNADIKINGILINKFNPCSNNNQNMKNLINKLGEYINAPTYKTSLEILLLLKKLKPEKQIFLLIKKTVQYLSII